MMRARRCWRWHEIWSSVIGAVHYVEEATREKSRHKRNHRNMKNGWENVWTQVSALLGFSGRVWRAVRAGLHTCALKRKHWWCWCSVCVCASEVVSLTSSSPEDAGAAQGWRCAASTWERAKRRHHGHTQLTTGRERRCEEEGFKRKNFEQQHKIHEKAEQFGDFDLCSWLKSF